MPPLRRRYRLRRTLTSPAFAVALAVSALGMTGAALAQADTVTKVPDAYLSGVSCANAATLDCVAVGQQPSKAGSTASIVKSRKLRISGGSVGAPEDLPVDFNGLSLACQSATSCLIAGFVGPSTNQNQEGAVVSVTNGAAGSPRLVPGTRILSGVACLSSSTCVAVGSAVPTFTGNDAAAVSIVNGVPGTAAAVQGGENFNLDAVACPSATSCTAVGYHSVPAGGCGDHCTNFVLEGVVVELGGSGAGAVRPVSGTSQLQDIDCAPGTTRCVVVGSRQTGTGVSQGVTVPISGGTVGAAEPAPSTGFLSGISCPSSSGCLAAGNDAEQSPSGVIVPVALGGMPGPPRSEADTYLLKSIDCADLSTCTAVGVADVKQTTGAVVVIGGGPATVQQSTAALSASLGVSGAAAKITSILKAGAYPAQIDAPSAGTAAIAWYYVPPGAHVAKARPVLIASGSKTATKKGKATVKVKLTKTGRTMLKNIKRGHRLGLTVKGSFTPKGGKKVTKKKAISLRA
jgi:hypothetical protein